MFAYVFSLAFWQTIMRMATPVIFASMAAVIGDKANVLCIGYEGIMLGAALGGVIGSAYSQSLFIGILLGAAVGILLTFIFSYFVLYLNTRALLAGLSINTFASGATIYAVFLLTGMKLNTIKLQSLQFPTINIPLLDKIPLIGPLLNNHNLMTYIAFVAVIFTWILLFRTRLGLRIRAVGKDPVAAASVGINVNKTKMIALLISGFLASFGGMYMSMGYLKYFTVGMIAGRGGLGIAAQRLGSSKPTLVMFIAIFFGFATSLGNLAQIYQLPSQFASMIPYLTTVIVLIVAGEINYQRSKKAPELKNSETKQEDK